MTNGQRAARQRAAGREVASRTRKSASEHVRNVAEEHGLSREEVAEHGSKELGSITAKDLLTEDPSPDAVHIDDGPEF